MWPTEQLLTVIAQASPRDCITEARLVDLTGRDAKAVEMSCLKLRKHGLLVRTGQDCHKLTAAGRAAVKQGARIRSGPKRPHYGKKIVLGTIRARVWAALRIPPHKYSVPDLVMLTVRGGEKDIQNNINQYLLALARGGYLRQMPLRERGGALTSNGYVRWWLIKNTGPLPPTWRVGANTIYDPNTEEEIRLKRHIPRASKRAPRAFGLEAAA